MEFICKHKEVADEIKVRNEDCTVSVDEGIDSLVHMVAGNQESINLAHDVLVDLGYWKKPTTKIPSYFAIHDQPRTEGAYGLTADQLRGK